MLEYGIKVITTNPTLITNANEVIRLVDSRNHQTRAFVIPAIYEAEVQKFLKSIEEKEWVAEKKRALKKHKETDELSSTLMEHGWEEIEEYLGEKR